MDFQTIQEKLNRGNYRTMEAFADDIDLIFRNCRQFNTPGSEPVLLADAVERAFVKEWARATQKGITPADKRTLSHMLQRMREAEEYIWFKDPVDPKVLVDYYNVIPKKDARDLSKMKAKVDSDKYESLDSVFADAAQLEKNAHVYNGPLDPVAILATRLKEEIAGTIAQLRKKRKHPDPGEAGGSGGSGANGASTRNGRTVNGAAPPKKLKIM